jgi:hypothetical protein
MGKPLRSIQIGEERTNRLLAEESIARFDRIWHKEPVLNSLLSENEALAERGVAAFHFPVPSIIDDRQKPRTNRLIDKEHKRIFAGTQDDVFSEAAPGTANHEAPFESYSTLWALRAGVPCRTEYCVMARDVRCPSRLVTQ